MSYTELYNRYKNNYRPLPKDIETIENLIGTRFSGYEIPLNSWRENEYIFDKDMDEQHVYKLFHVNTVANYRIQVKQILDVIESRINAVFKRWDRTSVYILNNEKIEVKLLLNISMFIHLLP
ncbi:hypothetical protein [Macrococcus brunensis]|uniref:hypothetical protein n=1 Tax=Macrococcus brunensis TaxID=198483 RepID=UPI001EF08D9C|nr:hypothetical protein [Macrococcus brunensis]ULG71974.1 hypothetical protein MGG12_00155 [Macrococcus brunensis]